MTDSGQMFEEDDVEVPVDDGTHCLSDLASDVSSPEWEHWEDLESIWDDMDEQDAIALEQHPANKASVTNRQALGQCI